MPVLPTEKKKKKTEMDMKGRLIGGRPVAKLREELVMCVEYC
jgi:hypothetical protein